MRRFLGILGLAAASAAIGCSTGSTPTEEGQFQAALRQTATCEEVLDAIQADALAKVDLELKAFADYQFCDSRFIGVPVGAEDFGGAGGQAGVPAAPTNDGAGAEAPRGVSDTNRQVADVDEADIVKAGDGGRKLYVIRGNGFYEFDSWPAADTAKVADLEIDGNAMEMFVEGDRAVVFSTEYRVLELDDGDLCGGYGGGVGVPEPGLVDEGFYCGRSYVKITVIDLAGDTPEAVREIYVDGWYTSSRRHDDIVRAVIQSHMQQPVTVPHLWSYVCDRQPYPESREAQLLLAQAWAEEAKDAIRATTLDQWMPVGGERIDGEIQEQPVQCADFYVPAPGLTNYGLTQIVGLDMTSDEPTRVTSILGQASTVYANAETMVLAQPDWTFRERGDDSDRTAVHRFAVSGLQQRTPYQGSGFVEGTVHDQFSIDEVGGTIRVATTRTTWPSVSTDPVAPDRWIPPTTDNLVSTMRLDGRALEVVGSTPPLAEGERIFSARFLGDLGYIVTFRQVDPLFAIDLSDPANPTVLGELKIPGFSDYMHPLGEDHLLTIGRDVDEETQFDRGTALQIFDVSDPTDPQLTHKALVGDGFSEANHNHKAFNFYSDRGLLAFPFVSYQGDFASTLELWDVNVDDGLSRRGAVDHSDLVLADCGGIPYAVDEFYNYCGYDPQITRGVFIDDYIYSISFGGVKVHAVDDLQTDVATATY